MTYAFQPYPAHRYGPNGVTRVVQSADEDTAAASDGFEDHPSKVGKTKAAELPKVPAPALAEKPAKGSKKATKALVETPLEATAFDRTAAIARLETANFEVDPATTDEELLEALKELDR